MFKKVQRILAACCGAVALWPATAAAWERPKTLEYPATVECLSVNLCLYISCPAPGKPSLEMMIDEHGRDTGEEISITIDGKRFPLILPEVGEHGLYRWPLSGEVADAVRKGRSGEVNIEPVGKGRTLPLRGSGAAVGKVLAQCSGEKQAQPAAAGGKLTGLSPETDCETAKTTGVVVSRELSASGKEIVAFRFKDKYGVAYINVDPPRNRAAVQAQLLQMIVPGAKLRATIHGCGAAARIEVLAAVEVLK